MFQHPILVSGWNKSVPSICLIEQLHGQLIVPAALVVVVQWDEGEQQHGSHHLHPRLKASLPWFATNTSSKQSNIPFLYWQDCWWGGPSRSRHTHTVTGRVCPSRTTSHSFSQRRGASNAVLGCLLDYFTRRRGWVGAWWSMEMLSWLISWSTGPVRQNQVYRHARPAWRT